MSCGHTWRRWWHDHQSCRQRPRAAEAVLGFGSDDPELMAAMFREICAIAFDDGMVFRADSVRAIQTRLAEHYGGIRVELDASLDGARLKLQADIGFGDAVTPAAPWTQPSSVPRSRPAMAGFPAQEPVEGAAPGGGGCGAGRVFAHGPDARSQHSGTGLSQFQLLAIEWADFASAAMRAEAPAQSDSRAAFFYCRRALELGVNWRTRHEDRWRRHASCSTSATG